MGVQGRRGEWWLEGGRGLPQRSSVPPRSQASAATAAAAQLTSFWLRHSRMSLIQQLTTPGEWMGSVSAAFTAPQL